jgi:outer membrane protein assembly factor BamD (BamD/ComL family)
MKWRKILWFILGLALVFGTPAYLLSGAGLTDLQGFVDRHHTASWAPGLMLKIGAAYRYTARPQEAAAAFQHYMDLYPEAPDYAEVWWTRTLCLEDADTPSCRRKAYEELLEFVNAYPDDPHREQAQIRLRRLQ